MIKYNIIAITLKLAIPIKNKNKVAYVSQNTVP